MAAKGKKRYQITLTQETVEKFQLLAEEMKLPQGTMSQILDESLQKVTETISRLKAKGTCTFADLLQMVGEQLDEIQSEVKVDDKKTAQEGKRKKKTGEVFRR